MTMEVTAPAEAAITVTTQALPSTSASPSDEMLPCDPALKAKKPKTRMKPPNAANYKGIIALILIHLLEKGHLLRQQSAGITGLKTETREKVVCEQEIYMETAVQSKTVTSVCEL